MKLLSLIWIIIFGVYLLALPAQVQAQEIKQVDVRALALRYYLENYESPLAEYSEKLIAEADRYKIDWKLLPAIAAVESNFGHRIPGGKDPDYTSHNAWGWGVYGQKALRFEDWDQSIEIVSEGINRRFIAEGLTDPYKMNPRYSSNPDWGWQVVYFIDELDSYSKAFEQKFGAQITAYNQRVEQFQNDLVDARKYKMPQTKIVVMNDRLGLNTR